MTFSPAWGYDGLAFDGGDMRHVVAALSRGRAGVLDDNDLAVTELATPGGSVKIGTGQLVIPASTGIDESYLGTCEVAHTVAVPPTSTNGRKDRLLVQIVAGVPTPVLVGGTPAASPAEPSIASYTNALELAMLNIPASTSTITNAMITDRRAHAWPAEVDPSTSQGAPMSGAFPAGSDLLVQGGNSLVTLNGFGAQTIAFPTPFPNGLLTVVCTVADALNQVIQVIYGSSTNASGFLIGVYRNTTGAAAAGDPCRFSWIALGF